MRRGNVLYELRRPLRDGMSHVVFEQLVLLERLAGQTLPPRMHIRVCHRVLRRKGSCVLKRH